MIYLILICIALYFLGLKFALVVAAMLSVLILINVLENVIRASQGTHDELKTLHAHTKDCATSEESHAKD